MIRFTVYGEAKTKGSTTAKYVPGKGRTFTRSPQNTKDWQALVSQVAQGHVPEKLLDGPLFASIVFYLPKPKNRPAYHRYPEKKPDLDKLVRAVLDGLKGIIYTDDARVVGFDRLQKLFGDPPRVEIAIREVSQREAI